MALSEHNRGLTLPGRGPEGELMILRSPHDQGIDYSVGTLVTGGVVRRRIVFAWLAKEYDRGPGVYVLSLHAQSDSPPALLGVAGILSCCLEEPSRDSGRVAVFSKGLAPADSMLTTLLDMGFASRGRDLIAQPDQLRDYLAATYPELQSGVPIV
jgi:hypothetical protein